jgi:transcriptional regulator with XRE-family HTH domain
MARNQRLHDAILRSGWRLEDLAEEVGADPKTVTRWITTGRLPRRASRQKLAEALAVPVAVLWPDAPGVAYGTSELVGIYTTRKELSPATIRSLVDAANEHIDVLAYAALWLWDAVPRFAERLAEKASSGVAVRVCLGDPDSEAVLRRGREEGIGEDGIASRCRLAIGYARPVQRADRGAIRTTGATLYSSVLRFDDELLVNTHLWGNAAADSPVFHLRRRDDRGIAASVLRSFERVWEEAQPASVG